MKKVKRIGEWRIMMSEILGKNPFSFEKVLSDWCWYKLQYSITSSWYKLRYSITSKLWQWQHTQKGKYLSVDHAWRRWLTRGSEEPAQNCPLASPINSSPGWWRLPSSSLLLCPLPLSLRGKREKSEPVPLALLYSFPLFINSMLFQLNWFKWFTRPDGHLWKNTHLSPVFCNLVHIQNILRSRRSNKVLNLPGTVLKRPIMCYIFEKQTLWGYQIWYWEVCLGHQLGHHLGHVWSINNPRYYMHLWCCFL